MRDTAFKQAAVRNDIPEDISKRMLEVSEAMVDAELCWYRHSAMMDANLNVLSGRLSRDEALTLAAQRFDTLSGSMQLAADARRLRDEWKTRLESAQAPSSDPSPRLYTNPWSTFAKARRYHWMSDDVDGPIRKSTA
jgi:hypothetical protein